MVEDNTIVEEALKLLKTDGDAVLAHALTDSVGEALDKVRGESSAHVESVTALSDQEKSKLTGLLKHIFARDLTTTYEVKKSLLGGFRVRVGDWKLDTTLLSQLAQMKQLLRGGVNG